MVLCTWHHVYVVHDDDGNDKDCNDFDGDEICIAKEVKKYLASTQANPSMNAINLNSTLWYDSVCLFVSPILIRYKFVHTINMVNTIFLMGIF